MAEPAEVVRALLEGAGLKPSEEEVAFYAAIYPRMRDMAASLYAIPEARYEEPATVYSPLRFPAEPVR